MKEKSFQAAVYLRLSREDGDVTDGGKTVSNSIANQNELVMDYLKSHPEIKVVDTYTDDGFSGVNTKDFSRLGRDYLEVGNYMEITFPMLGVRYIAVNERYDSKESSGATGGLSVALKCQTAHCGRRKPHFDFGRNTSPIVPYRHLPQTLRGLTADCRSLV